MCFRLQKLKAEADRRKKEDDMRKRLTENMAEESKFAKLNLAKIQNQYALFLVLSRVPLPGHNGVQSIALRLFSVQEDWLVMRA